MDYDLTPREPKQPKPGFSNKSMRVIDRFKPHIVKIDGWYRVTPTPKRRTYTDMKRWNEAHRFASRLNADIYIWPYIQPIPSELLK